MISTKIISFVMALSIALIIILMLGGCAANGKYLTNMADSTSTNVRMLIGWGGRPYTLIELVNNSIFEVALISQSWTEYSSITRDDFDVFDETLLDDFALADSKLYEILSNPFTREIHVREFINKGEAELSQQQWDNIWHLVENIASNDADGAFDWAPVHGLPYVWAIIDGSFYWSLFHLSIDDSPRRYRREINPFINRDLMLLANELIYLSPVLVGGEHNPVIWPE